MTPVTQARAPARIDFAGGPSDVAPFCIEEGGAVVNAAINIYAYVQGETTKDNSYRITSENFDISATFASYQDLIDRDVTEIHFLQKMVQHVRPTQGVDLFVRSQAPPGAGLGSSGAVGVATLAVLKSLTGANIDLARLAIEAVEVETQMAAVVGGCQDQIAAVNGGFQFIKVKEEGVEVQQLSIQEYTIAELEARSLLCYTGQARLSGGVISEVMLDYQRGDKRTRAVLRRIRDIAALIRDALMSGNVDDFAELVKENWQQRRQLHPAISTNETDTLMEVALREGAVGGKLLGAGGGGCVYLICGLSSIGKVTRSIEKLGVRVLPFSFVSHGLGLWTPKK